MEQQVLYSLVAQEPGGQGQQGDGAQQPGCGMMGSPLIMILLMFAVIFFMIIRPQQKQQKKQKAMLGSLKKGDRIITNSGIFGTITGLTEAIATLEIAKNVHIRVLRGQIAGMQPETIGKAGEAQPVVPEEKK